MKNLILFAMFVTGVSMFGHAQSYDLPKMLADNKLVVFHYDHVFATDASKHAISSNRIVWLKDVNFSEGTIEVDLKGHDVLQRSFLGIAFHGVDTITYDCIYFRPFNFRATDPVRKIHAVQYIAQPDYPWEVTREKMNGIYEKAVVPAPEANAWFHAKIVVKGKQVTVYVNGSETPSLTITKLNDRTNGLIGLWNTGLNGEFANLVIRKE